MSENSLHFHILFLRLLSPSRSLNNWDISNCSKEILQRLQLRCFEFCHSYLRRLAFSLHKLVFDRLAQIGVDAKNLQVNFVNMTAVNPQTKGRWRYRYDRHNIRCYALLCRSKLNRKIYFEGKFFRVFDRGWNNCYFDSTVKITITPQNKILRHRLVLTDRHNINRYTVQRAVLCILYSVFPSNTNFLSFSRFWSDMWHVCDRGESFGEEWMLGRHLPSVVFSLPSHFGNQQSKLLHNCRSSWCHPSSGKLSREPRSEPNNRKFPPWASSIIWNTLSVSAICQKRKETSLEEVKAKLNYRHTLQVIRPWIFCCVWFSRRRLYYDAEQVFKSSSHNTERISFSAVSILFPQVDYALILNATVDSCLLQPSLYVIILWW